MAAAMILGTFILVTFVLGFGMIALEKWVPLVTSILLGKKEYLEEDMREAEICKKKMPPRDPSKQPVWLRPVTITPLVRSRRYEAVKRKKPPIAPTAK